VPPGAVAEPIWNPAWRGDLLAGIRRIGAEALERWQRHDFSVELKGRIDPVTEVDRWVEQTLRELLLGLCPAASFIGEESWQGETPGNGWVVDPIDGTVNFAAGLPQFALSVAWLEQGRSVFGCVFAPALGEFFWAEEGAGSYLNGTRLKVSDVRELVNAVGASGFPYWVREQPRERNNLAAWEFLLVRVRALRRGGCASLDLAYTAAGRFGFFWEPGLKLWDVAAGRLLVEEAGGVVSRYDGTPFTDGFVPILAAAPQMHKELVHLLTPFDHDQP